MVEFIVVLLAAIVVIFFSVCVAGVAIAVVCIFKITEKIIEAIEKFFNNL